MRIANTIFAALFVFGAVVQFNDPDPLPWILIYLAGAGACVWAVRRPESPLPALIVAVVCVVWAAVLSPHVFGQSSFGEMFEAWEMKDERVEYSREMYGLALIGGWMIVNAIRGFRIRSQMR